MARKSKVVLVCDRHRGEVEAVASVEVALDGDRRRMDLCAEHIAEFQKAIKPWTSIGAGGRTRRSAKPAGTGRTRRAAAGTNGAGTKAAAKGAADAGPVDANAIRAWARDNGYTVGARGRIPAPVREAYAAATGS